MAATQQQIDRMLADSRPLLDALGATAVGYFRDSFQRQSFGADRWLPRYPSQPADQVVNIAGILSDANAGRGFPGRRFENRPALIDRGGLRDSLAWQVNPGAQEVEAGSNLPYADIQNEGGLSGQPVTAGAKTRIARLIRQRPHLGAQLSPLLSEDVHLTDVVGRRFVGMNAELERLLAAAVVEAVEDL